MATLMQGLAIWLQISMYLTVYIVLAFICFLCIYPFLTMMKKLFITPITIIQATDIELREAQAFALNYAKQRREASATAKNHKILKQSMEEVRQFWAL